jgi:20S proteasome subunit alpha 5
MTLKEAETLIVKLLREMMEESLNATNIELVSVTPLDGVHIYSTEELNGLLKNEKS